MVERTFDGGNADGLGNERALATTLKKMVGDRVRTIALGLGRCTRRLTTRAFHMSDLAPQVVWPSSVWVDRTQRWRAVAASAAFWAIVAAGAGLTIAAAVHGWASVVSS